MPWNISCTGKPESVLADLQRYGATLIGESLTEYERVMPSLLTIVSQNVGPEDSGYAPPVLEVVASGGSGYAACQVNINICK